MLLFIKNQLNDKESVHAFRETWSFLPQFSPRHDEDSLPKIEFTLFLFLANVMKTLSYTVKNLGLREEYDGPTGLVLILYGRKVQTMEGESNKYSITCIVKISRLISSGQYFKIRYQLHSGQVAKVMIQTYKLTNTIGRSIWKNSLYVFVVRKSFKKRNFWVLHMIFSYFLSRR